ncbi:MAG: hypothetical protein ACP5GL_08565, partial [Infirmifilum sp.]
MASPTLTLSSPIGSLPLNRLRIGIVGMSAVTVEVPRTLYEEAMKKEIDVDELVIDTLVKALNLDPETTARARLELATKYINEGRELVDKDP